MALDPDAQAVVDGMGQVFTEPISVLGVAEVRRRTAGAPPLPAPEIHSSEDRTVPGPHGDIPVRVYRPSDDEDLPVLVWLHGGGWSLGDLSNGELVSRTLANDVPCVVVSVDYRLAPEHKFPVPFEECLAVVRWVAENGAELGADGSRLAVGGDSAGGNLSAAVALAAREEGGPEIALQLLVYPATEHGVERASWKANAQGPVITTDDVLYLWGQYLRDEADRADWRAMPSTATSLEGVAPALVITADSDPLRDDGAAYAEALRAAGVEATHTNYDGVMHGFFTMPGLIGKATQANAEAAAALRTAFAKTKESVS